MAKKQQSATESAKTDTLARIKRTEAYAESVRVLFARCVNEILALHKTLPKLGEGEMYSFDGDSPRIQKQVEELLRRLAAAATLAVENGIQVEWNKANEAADALLQSCFGKNATKDVHYSAWRKRNEGAMMAFKKRTDSGGFNLSDNIWKATRQLRDEMEVAMTIGIGEGESAAEMSRKVRKYLNDPDLMFRRFRYKAGEKEVIDYDAEGNPIGTHMEAVYGRKWKKKVKDKDGKTRWVDYDKDDYKVGRGNYKSSARNAMRVTRTETNMAYRASDQTRWSQMDFVLGIHIEPSRSHPKKDICDKLAGDYPKDFKFEGWHPQCFCVMTPILISEDEMAKVTEAFAKGEKYVPQGKRVTTYPQGFKDWVTAHHEEIQDAHDYGRDPYFVRHNFDIVQNIWKPKKSALEIAEARHAARTDDEIDAIRRRARTRSKAMHSAERLLQDFENFSDVDTTALQEAYNHADWNAVRKEALVLAQKKRAIIEEAISLQKELDGISDVNTQQVSDAFKSDKLYDVKIAINDLQKTKAQLESLKHLENPVEAAKQASLQVAVAINNSVEKKLDSWSYLPLKDKKSYLEKEINKWADDAKYGLQSKYPNSWKISQAAYLKELDATNDAIDWEDIQDQYAVLKAYQKETKSKIYPVHIANIQQAIAEKDKAKAQQIIATASSIKKKLEGITAKRSAGADAIALAKGIKFKKDDFSQSRKDGATWHTDMDDARDDFFPTAVDTWSQATMEEKVACVRYTEGSGYITKYLRGVTGYYERDSSYADKAKADSESITKYIGRARSKRDYWIKRDEIAALTTYKFGVDVTSILDGERMRYELQKEIDNIKSLSCPSYYSAAEWKKRCADRIKQCKEKLKAINTPAVKTLVGRVGIDESFMSCGTSKDAWFSGTGGDNKNGRPRVVLNLYCPKGTMMAYADPFNYYTTGGRSSSYNPWDGQTRNRAGECEIFMQRGTKMKITKAEYDPVRDFLFLDVDIIEQRCPEFETEYVAGEGYKARYK